MRLFYGLLLASLAACGSSTGYGNNMSPPPPPGPPPPPPPPGSVAVTISDYKYAPDTVSIKAGTTVIWTNTGITHTVTSDSAGAFNSGDIAGPMPDGYGGTTGGGTFSHVFATSGTFKYHCNRHPTLMNAVVLVTP